MRIHLKIIDKESNPTIITNTNSIITELHHSYYQYCKENPSLFLLLERNKSFTQEDVHQTDLINTLIYFFKNNFEIISNVLMDDLIDVPNNCPITLKLLEDSYHGWLFCTLNKGVNPNRLPIFILKSMLSTTKEEWNRFLPILSIIEETHILYFNIWVYMIKDYSGENKFTLKVEHFIDFTCNNKRNKKEVSKKTLKTLDENRTITLDENVTTLDENVTTSTTTTTTTNNISLEKFNFHTLQEVKDCLYKVFPEKFKEEILHCNESKEFLPVPSKRKSKIKKNK